jgi:hypothetical protein
LTFCSPFGYIVAKEIRGRSSLHSLGKSTGTFGLEDDREPSHFFAALTHLLVRYPSIVRHVERVDEHIDLTFFVEDLAIDFREVLENVGIAAIHRSDKPKSITLNICRVPRHRTH